MPALVAFGRRWSIASDDFVFPSLSEAIVRLSWVTVTCLLFILKSWTGCSSPHVIACFFALIAANILTMIICVITALISARGSILESKKRRHVVTVAYIRLPLFLFEIALAIAATVFAFGNRELCNFDIPLRLSVLLQWTLIATVMMGIAVIFNPSGDNRLQVSLRSEHQAWNLRFKLLTIGRNEAMRSALDDIALLTTSFFADINLVASDILAGLLLLVHAPHQAPSAEEYNPRNETPSWMSFENARYMIKYAAAVYGWELYMAYNCGCGDWWKVMKRMSCCGCCCRKNSVPIIKDNCCYCATATFLTVAECQKSDIIFVSFRNQLYQVPFIVLFDEKRKNVVITIRGTASMVDAINDLSLDDEAFSVDIGTDPILHRDKNLPDEEVRVHRGMMRSARYVFETLCVNKVLENAHIMHPDYNVVVCGHSLGAGVACLLVLLLKQTYKNIQCYAFSPPGCVINEYGLKETEKYVFSVFVGDDVVPRLSYHSVCTLKYDVIKSLAASNMPKYKILLEGFYRLCFSSPWTDEETAEAASEPVPASEADTILPLVFINPLSNYNDIDSDNASTAGSSFKKKRIRLLPPGRLLHVWVNDKMMCAKWVHYSSLREIKLSSAVISDHMPYYVMKVLNMDISSMS